MLRPEIAARNTIVTNFANPVTASKERLPPSILCEQGHLPGRRATMKKLFTVSSKDQDIQKAITREWSREARSLIRACAARRAFDLCGFHPWSAPGWRARASGKMFSCRLRRLIRAHIDRATDIASASLRSAYFRKYDLGSRRPSDETS